MSDSNSPSLDEGKNKTGGVAKPVDDENGAELAAHRQLTVNIPRPVTEHADRLAKDRQQRQQAEIAVDPLELQDVSLEPRETKSGHTTTRRIRSLSPGSDDDAALQIAAEAVERHGDSSPTALALQSPKALELAQRVAELTDEAERKAQQLRVAKEELQKQNRSAAAKALEMLQKKLNNLTGGIDDNRSRVSGIKSEIDKLQQQHQDLLKEEDARIKRVRRGEMEQKAFEITGRNIEYENVQAHRKRLDDEIRQRMAVLKAISELDDDARDARENTDRALTLLQRINHFKKYIDGSPDLAGTLPELQGQNFGQAMSMFRSLDIVRAAKAEAHANKQRIHKDEMHELNLKRRQMEKKIKKLEVTKQIFVKKQRKGLRYLVDREIESTHNGAESDEEPQLDDIDDHAIAVDGGLTAAELLKRAEKHKKIGDLKARQLRAGIMMDKEQHLALRPMISFIKPYDGSLGAKSYGTAGPPSSWKWIREVVWQVAEQFMLRYFNSDKPLKMLKSEKLRVEQTEQTLEKEIAAHRLERVVYEVCELCFCLRVF